MIPRNWARMGAIIALAYTAVMVLARDLAPPDIAALAWAAVLLTLVGSHIARLERRPADKLQSLTSINAICVIVPHALAGVGLGLWMTHYGLDPRLVLGGLLAINAVSVTLLLRRPSQLYIGMAGLWAPAALLDGSLLAISVIVLVGIVMAVSAHIQKDGEQDDLDWLLSRERACDRYEDILRDYEEMGHGWFWETDRRGHLTYVSPIVGDVVGEHHENLVGHSFRALFDGEGQPAESARALAFHISTRSPFHDLAFPAASEGDERWWSVSGRPVFDEFQNFVGFRGSGTDLTERRRNQESASRLALYDSLTGLANRFQTMQTLGKILGSPQEIQRECSIFLLDLDRFKQVNDTLGHPVGDALLKQVARRLEKTVGDAGIVGRLGGDEFTIIAAARPDRAALGKLSHEIIYALSQPYWLDGQRVVIGASIGIAIAPGDGATSDALIRSADLALYASKNGGRGRYQFYSKNMLSAYEERAALERALRVAIAQGGLQLFYQPIVHTATERITGFEALLRWNHPEKGWIPPSKFLPIAEDAGLISAIGDWAIRTACEDLALWPDEIRCAVNVSSLQLSNPHFPTVVTQALAKSGISPDRLELEITESAFLNDGPGTGNLLTSLKSIGVRLALDDFGTGYSSFAHLETAPFDKIKIDRRFVRNAALPGSRKGAMIAAMTTLAQNLGIDTTAEGVETLDELNLVRMHGCSHVQGHVYEEPLSGKNALARLQSGVAAVADGPRSSREPRQTVLRKVLLEHGNEVYSGTVRNISSRGVMIEGLWDVPEGTLFQLALSEFHTVLATCRWNESGRMGAEFSTPLKRDRAGNLIAIKGPPSSQNANLLPHKF